MSGAAGLYSVAEATFTVFGVEMRCHVLNNGERVLEADGLEKFFDEHNFMPSESDEGMAALIAFLKGRA